MVGEARTVVRGTDIVTFPVRVIDVQRGADGPGGALILARAEGPLMQQTGGVAEGMSGSPVYVTGADGVARVIGAVAFGAGDQDNVDIGLTPIEQMIDSATGQRAQERAPAPPRAERRVAMVRTRAAARRLERAPPRPRRPLPARALDRRRGLAAADRPARARAREVGHPAQLDRAAHAPVRRCRWCPARTMTALLGGGDIAIGAIGTVTYVDGSTILGFGHPFLSAGRSRFLMSDGYVFQTVAAPITNGSYKLAEPGVLRGMITGDRADGISGTIGPVEGIDAVGTARDLGRGTASTVRGTIAPDPRTAPIVGGLVQDEPAVRVLDGIEGGTLSLRVVIRSPDLAKPVVYRNLYAAAGDVTTLASGQVPRLLSILMENGVRAGPAVSKVSV